ncbi:MAG: preprotein translocase subunit SecG [Pseudomonadota bacterium]|nr:preprotein translocase subunit SecG [Pseudomonadota bacterium]
MIATLVLVLHVLAAVLLVGLVLIQQGQGADAGAAFGSGASQTVFGAQGAGSFLTRATSILAMLFFATSLTLAYFANSDRGPVSVLEKVTLPASPEGLPGSGMDDQFEAPAADDSSASGELPAIPD